MSAWCFNISEAGNVLGTGFFVDKSHGTTEQFVFTAAPDAQIPEDHLRIVRTALAHANWETREFPVQSRLYTVQRWSSPSAYDGPRKNS